MSLLSFYCPVNQLNGELHSCASPQKQQTENVFDFCVHFVRRVLSGNYIHELHRTLMNRKEGVDLEIERDTDC